MHNVIMLIKSVFNENHHYIKITITLKCLEKYSGRQCTYTNAVL